MKINWVAVQPQLFGPMMRRAEVDGTGGFTNSNIPAALELGFTWMISSSSSTPISAPTCMAWP